MSSPAQHIGWVGLGNMGFAMAGHVQRYLERTGAPGLVFINRTISRGDSLKPLGAVAAESIEEVFERSDIVFISVANDAVVSSVVETALRLPSGIRGKVVCDLSTIHPDTAGRLSHMLDSAGASFVAAPVFGSTSVAESGGLVMILSGPADSIDRVKPFCEGVMGRATIQLGSDPRAACSLKVTGNSILLSLAEIISCAHVLAEKADVGSNPVERLLDLMFNGGPMLNYSRRVTEGGYAPAPDARPSFGIDLAIKDAGLAIDLAKSVCAPLPVVEIARMHLEEAREKHGGHLDSTAIYGVLREQAGLPFASKVVEHSGRRMEQ